MRTLAWMSTCLALVTSCQGYFFESGYSHHYTYWAEHSIFGQKKITTVFKFQVSPVNQTEDGHRLHSLSVDSVVQLVEGGFVFNNPLKWDLSKVFLFKTDGKGTVTIIHCHPEDHEELLVIKKAMVSVFSVHVKIDEDKKEWQYSVVETDHHGQLEHTYQVSRTDTGMKLHRRHYSVDKAHRFHNKTLHYDHKGTVLSAQLSDRILLKNTKKPPSKATSPGETSKTNVASNSMPEIDVTASVTVSLDQRRAIHKPPRYDGQNLQVQTLEVNITEKLVPFHDVKENITAAFECLKKHLGRGNLNRSECVERLRRFVTKLKSPDYENFVNNILGTSCPHNNTMCDSRRMAVLDIVGGKGNSISQQLLLRHVINKPVVDEGELQKVFMHCIALKHPDKEFINAINKYCFGENDEFNGSQTMNSTQRMACLAVGSLAHNLAQNGKEDLAHELTNRLETWLDKHGKADRHVQKRDTAQQKQHHLSKAILLHALGNAAMIRSKRHLLNHAEPNRGHHTWRRAAVESLGRYSCHETAAALYNVIKEDEMRSVSRQAFHVFRRHPSRKTVVRSEENGILSQNYTYPIVVRVRRNVDDSMSNKVMFSHMIDHPPKDINTPTGISDAGGNANVQLQTNAVEPVMRPLDSHYDVDINNLVGSDADVGLINMKKNLIKFDTCYKGRVKFNVNMMKDFDIGYFRDMPRVFARLAPDMMQPLKTEADSLAAYYQDPVTNRPISGFQQLTLAVTQLPQAAEGALSATIEFHKATMAVTGLPSAWRLRQLAAQAQSLVEDVRTEIITLYAGLVDSAVVVLPLAENEIRNSLNVILSNMDKTGQYPRQVFPELDKAMMRYWQAVQRIIEAGNRIKQAVSFVSASRSNFMNTAHEITDVIESTKVLIQNIKDDQHRRANSTSFHIKEPNMDDVFNKALDHLYTKSDSMIRELNNLKENAATQLQEGLDKQSHYSVIIMTHMERLKEVINTIKSQLNELLGLKFHPKFPNVRRPCDDRCGCGVYPAGFERYGHQGVEIKLGLHEKVYSPVSAMLFAKHSSVLSLIPVTTDFSGYEILLSNVRSSLHIPEDGLFVTAGEDIGYPAGTSGCNDVHFQIAMRSAVYAHESNNTNFEDRQSNKDIYVDPTPYLSSVFPATEWGDECSDYNLRILGLVHDHGPLSRGVQERVTDMQATLSGFADKFPSRSVGEPSSILPPDTQTVDRISGHSDQDPSNLKNIFTYGQYAAQVFFANISVNNYNLESLRAMAKEHPNDTRLSASLTDVENLLKTAQEILESPKVSNLPYLPTGSLERMLSMHREQKADTDSTGTPGRFDLGSSAAGGRSAMETAFRISLAQGCPHFGDSVLKSPYVTCLPDHDCLGVNCEASVYNSVLQDRLLVSIRANPEQQTIAVTVNGSLHVISGNGRKMLFSDLRLLGPYRVSLKSVAVWYGSGVKLSLTLQSCTAEKCLTKIVLLDEVVLENNSPAELLHRRVRRAAWMPGSTNHDLIGTLLGVAGMGLSFGGLTNLLTSQMMPASEPILSAGTFDLASEFSLFIDAEDHSVGATFHHNFPVISNRIYYFMAGPVPLSFGINLEVEFGATPALKVDFTEGSFDVSLELYTSVPFRVDFALTAVVADVGISAGGSIIKSSLTPQMHFMVREKPLQIQSDVDVKLIPIELKLTWFVRIIFFIRFDGVIFQANVVLDKHGIHADAKFSNGRKPVFSFNPSIPELHGLEKVTPALSEYSKVLGSTYSQRYRQMLSNLRTHSTRSRRSVERNVANVALCSVQQVPGRHPKDPAFKLEFSVADDESSLKLSYAVGDYPDGTNVRGWTEMRGSSLVASADLPCGIPLYFLVKAQNSEGLEAIAQCSLPTYDCTLPDGRLDAAFRCSSHQGQLSASLVLYDDSELVEDGLLQGVGYSPGSSGDQVVDWLPLNISNSFSTQRTSGDLANFGTPRPGGLTNTPMNSIHLSTVSACASECVKKLNCLAFSYSEFLHECELQRVLEGVNSERRADQDFQTYEKLGKAYTASLNYQKLLLRHGTMYYINVDVINVLGYHSTLTSEGTMVDFTPPEPGLIRNAKEDVVVADGCDASVIQRCVNAVEGTKNHRIIIDGVGSATVFNGNNKGQDMLFTKENYHIAGNWQDLKDQECGIHGYTWAVGKTVCGSDVVSFTDPHASIPNPHDWTNLGEAHDLQLLDGQYFVTVQAVSDIIHGGDLVTTVCHSIPLTVDTTPPLMNKIKEFLFDETFHYLVIYYDASDDVSGIGRVEFGLGETKYDVTLKGYQPFVSRGSEGNTYLVVEDFETVNGQAAWIRLKVVNNVDISTTGSSDEPILIDQTAPIAGQVLDGEEIGLDTCCQDNDKQICAQWTGFQDPESNIESFKWGAGHSPGTDDVVSFRTLHSFQKMACAHVQLNHSMTYFSTVVAYNKALNTKSVNTSSDGVLVDTTPPEIGVLVDGKDVHNDMNYTSETATLSAAWSDFKDPESGMAPYSLAVFINNNLQRTFSNIVEEQFTDHSFSFSHGDHVHVQLLAKNRAGGQKSLTSDGVMVDHTPPELLYISTKDKSPFQQQADSLGFLWSFRDLESGVSQYRLVVIENFAGVVNDNFWPGGQGPHIIYLNSSSNSSDELTRSLQLKNGGQYSLRVTALNRANLAIAEESNSVMVDTTAPEILQVRLALKDEEEDVNDDNEVEHMQGEPLWVSWKISEPESGVQDVKLCVSLADSSQSCLGSEAVKTVVGSASVTSFKDDDLLVTQIDGTKTEYQVELIVTNRAGLQSKVVFSKHFIVRKANVAGIVKDGRGVEDEDFSSDKASIAITFNGFSSDMCGIDGYEWGIGTSPFTTDVMPYTDFGLVVDDDGNGFAQVHIMQFEGQKYYSTVRAKTGYGCSEEYIVASSDGFILDTTPPHVTFHVDSHKTTSHEVVYQTETDRLDIAWSIVDPSGVNETLLTLDMFSNNPIIRHVTAESNSFTPGADIVSGDSVFSSLTVSDTAGNQAVVHLPPVTVDLTTPELLGLTCTDAVSSVFTQIECSWESVKEYQSPLASIQFGLGTDSSFPNLHNFSTILLEENSWALDTREIVSALSIDEVYVIIRLENAVGLKSDIQVKVVYDRSPPTVAKVAIVTSSQNSFHDTEQQCQTSEDYVEVAVQGAMDNETNIASIEIALGSSQGRNDISPFKQYHLNEAPYIVGQLSLQKGSSVYATVRITNTVGLYTVSGSNRVVISPEPYLQVKDGMGEQDIDGQSELDILQGSWTYSDPCPVLNAKWSIRELGGAIITNFTTIPNNGQKFYNDSMSLENFKTYISFIKIVDALNRTFTAYSDGVTILVRQPDSAVVRDGLGETDMKYQEPTDQLSSNWDEFGNAKSTLPSDHILRYEVAVGTDRRYATTHSDIHSFEDVGLERHVTFYGLNLTEKTTVYYVTVRAYSAAGSFIESSSDGIRVGYSADVIAGHVGVNRHQSGTDSIRFWWTDFDSDIIITHYYAGLSSLPPPIDNTTHQCSQFIMDSQRFFDVRKLQVLESDSMAVISGLSLAHGQRYYVTVVAVDEMGLCSASVSEDVHVDTTPPVEGQITAEGFESETVIFLHSLDSVLVKLNSFADPESGIGGVTLDLMAAEECDLTHNTDKTTVINSVVASDETSIALRNLKLVEKMLYFINVTVTNRVGLSISSMSRPMIVDISQPHAGVVRVGTAWTEPDLRYQNQTHTVNGVIALKSVSSEQHCVTQVDVLSTETRKQWIAKQGVFIQNCVQLDASGLYVFVRHNPFFTGVDKGTAQLNEITLREGNYTFRLTAGQGSHIMTGITLGSPLLSPPFFPGNVSSTQRDALDVDSLSNENNSTEESSFYHDTDYGLGISFVAGKDATKTMFWAQDKYKQKVYSIETATDPAVSEAVYTISLKQSSALTDRSWDITLLVNDQIQQSVTGFMFPQDVALIVYAWNVDGYFPPVVNPFKPFQTAMHLAAAAIPAETRPLCSYGEPFQDHESGIKEIWAGVSDSMNETANVCPFKLIKSFCLSSLGTCNSACTGHDDEMLSEDFRLLNVELNGLTLEAANEVLQRNDSAHHNSNLTNDLADLNAFDQPTFFLDVRIVDQGGLVTESKSAGLTVDTSPPKINFIHILDPVYSTVEPVVFVGNNHTVGVEWGTIEDVSVITRVSLSLGTQPHADDLSPRLYINKVHGKYIFDDLISPLSDKSIYYITVDVENAAGLTSRAWSNFTVHVTPPDMSAVKLTLPNVTSVNISGTSVGLLENANKLEIDINLSPADRQNIEYYEWAIGTDYDKDNIFPRTRVGLNDTTKVALVNGYMQLEGLPPGISIGDFARKNRSFNAVHDNTTNKFKMEPGRCLKQRIYGINKAHIITPIDVTPTCIKRSQDRMIPADSSVHKLWVEGDRLSEAAAPTAGQQMGIRLKLRKGAVLGGVLTETDLDAQYGSSASTTFSPFINRPEPATDDTSRLLRGRVKATPGPHVFLSPVADAQFEEDVEISYVLPSSIPVPTSGLVTLMMWNPETRQWVLPGELCPDSEQNYDNITRTVKSRICPEAFADGIIHSARNNIRQKRGITHVPCNLAPRMLTVAVIQSSIVNQPPTIHHSSYTILEDEAMFNFTIHYSDVEQDRLRFWLRAQPHHGSATVTPDGTVSYSPAPNFVGQDIIYLAGEELPTSEQVQPNTVNFSVTVDVSGVNDPPAIFYLPESDNRTVTQEMVVGPEAGIGQNMTVFIEGNTTTHAVLGVIVFGDVDSNDSVTFINSSSHVDGAEFEVSDLQSSDPLLSSFTLHSGPVGKEITLNMSEGFSGQVTFEARVKDTAGAFSMQLTMNVFVLINPCLHGRCEVETGTCYDTRRAFSFGPFACGCDPGYESEWCDVDTDECRTATCSPITDCVDLVNGYRCDPNTSKLAAIVVCSVLAVVLTIVTICKLKKKSSKVGDKDLSKSGVRKPERNKSSTATRTHRASAEPKPDYEDTYCYTGPYISGASGEPLPDYEDGCVCYELGTRYTSMEPTPDYAGTSFTPFSLSNMISEPQPDYPSTSVQHAVPEPDPDYLPKDSRIQRHPLAAFRDSDSLNRMSFATRYTGTLFKHREYVVRNPVFDLPEGEAVERKGEYLTQETKF